MTENKSLEWSTENRLQMLQAIARAIPEPKKDNISYHTRLLKVDWSSIQISGFSTEQVKNEFSHLIGRVSHNFHISSYTCNFLMITFTDLRDPSSPKN